MKQKRLHPVGDPRLVLHLRSIAAGFALIGEAAWVILIMLSMVPLFLLTAKSMNETMGEWHVRIFGETLRDKFLPNSSVSML